MAISEAIKKDVMNQVGSIFSWNTPNAIGYVFTKNRDGKQISTGMFVSSKDEVDHQRWDGFFCYEDKKFYDLTKGD